MRIPNSGRRTLGLVLTCIGLVLWFAYAVVVIGRESRSPSSNTGFNSSVERYVEQQSLNPLDDGLAPYLLDDHRVESASSVNEPEDAGS